MHGNNATGSEPCAMRICKMTAIDDLKDTSACNWRSNSPCLSGNIVGHSEEKRAPCSANSKSTSQKEGSWKLDPSRSTSRAVTGRSGRARNFYAKNGIAFADTHGQVSTLWGGAGRLERISVSPMWSKEVSQGAADAIRNCNSIRVILRLRGAAEGKKC